MGNGGADALASALCTNSTLLRLSLRDSKMSEEDALSLITALEKNASLLHLYLDDMIGTAAKEKLVKMCKLPACVQQKIKYESESGRAAKKAKIEPQEAEESVNSTLDAVAIGDVTVVKEGDEWVTVKTSFVLL